jgi:hypothetical protein
MRAGLLVAGLLFLVIGIVLDVTLIGAVIGLPIGAIGVIMIIVGFFTGGGSKTSGGQQNSDEKQRRYQRYQAEQYDRHRREIDSQEKARQKQ